MKFFCCGLVYSTDDPETYWCIEKYKMIKPSIEKINGKKIVKEIIYVLFCKKNGCLKIEAHRFFKQNGKIQLLEKRFLKGKSAKDFFDKTRQKRIRQTQIEPKQDIKTGNSIPWVYGKCIDSETQVARYIDESGNRCILKNNKLVSETYKSTIQYSTLTL